MLKYYFTFLWILGFSINGNSQYEIHAKYIFNDFINLYEDSSDDNYTKFEKGYLTMLFSIEVVDEKSNKQMSIKDYFKSIKNDKFSVIKQKNGNKFYVTPVANTRNLFNIFITIKNETTNEKTKYRIRCKGHNDKSVHIYAILINGIGILENVESDESIASIGLGLGSLINKKVFSNQLRLNEDGDNFYLNPVNFFINYKITGIKKLEGLRIRFNFSLAQSNEKNTWLTSDSTSKNTLPFSSIDINKKEYYSAGLDLRFYILQGTKWFDEWQKNRWDIYLLSNLSYNYYKFSGEKAGINNLPIEYNFIINDYNYGFGIGVERWIDPALNFSIFAEYSRNTSIMDIDTKMQINSSSKISFGLKYNFY